MEITKFYEKLNKVDGKIYVIEEEIRMPKNGVYEAPLMHDNITVSTLNVYTGPKLTGKRVQTYALTTPSLTPWKRIIRIQTEEPVVYLTYETDGDTVEAEDVNNLQDAVVKTQDEVNREADRAKAAEEALDSAIRTETERALAAEEQLTAELKIETGRAKEREEEISRNLSSEEMRAVNAENDIKKALEAEEIRAEAEEIILAGNLAAEADRAKDAEKTIAEGLETEKTRAEGAENVLKGDINAETKRATNAEKKLEDELSAEITRAKAAETLNAENIEDEAVRAESAEKAIKDDMDSEIIRAKAEEKKLTEDLGTESIRAEKAEKILEDRITAERERAEEAERENLNTINAEKIRAIDAEEAIRVTITENKPNWDDKYTRNEVDNKFSALETAIDWKEAVNTYSDLEKVYPKPDDGWTVNVKDTDYTYRWNGTKWIAISANAIPKATQGVDGLLGKDDKAAYDDAYSKRHTHENKSTLDKLTDVMLSNWTDAYNKRHEHSNKTILDKLTQAFLDNWNAAYSHISNKSNPHGITKTQVGLGNVNNTSDMDKPVSTAMQAALDKKSPEEGSKALKRLAGQVTLGEGGEFTILQNNGTYHQKIECFDNSSAGDTVFRFLQSEDSGASFHTLFEIRDDGYAYTGKGKIYSDGNKPSKSDVGLGNVPNVTTNNQTPTFSQVTTLDNISSGEKLTVMLGKIEKAIADFISHKADIVLHIKGTERINWNDANSKKHTHSNKSVVDKLTQAMLDKLAGIDAGAEVNVQPDWNETDIGEDSYIKNKPKSMPASDVPDWAKAAVKPSYNWTEVTGKPGTFPPSSHTHTKSQISDMPTKVSQFSNDAGYITSADVDTSQNHTHANKTVLDKVTQAMLDKLAGVAEEANKYVHPTTAGNKHIPSGGASGQILRWSADGTAVWGADKDTVYTHPSTHPGSMISEDATHRFLRDYCKTITDWNDAVTNGLYMASGATNAPASGWFFGRVIAHTSNYVYQEAYQFTASTDAKAVPKYIRCKMNGTWGEWTNVTVSISVPSNAKFTDTVYSHPNSGATAGTYKSVTVNAQGHVTGGNNPTTLAGYGITDAAAKSHNHDSTYLKKGSLTWADLGGG